MFLYINSGLAWRALFPWRLRARLRNSKWIRKITYLRWAAARKPFLYLDLTYVSFFDPNKLKSSHTDLGYRCNFTHSQNCLYSLSANSSWQKRGVAEKKKNAPTPPTNLFLSAYSFFSRNFLFAFCLSECAIARERTAKHCASGNTVKCECTSSDCSRKSGWNPFRLPRTIGWKSFPKREGSRKTVRAIVVIERSNGAIYVYVYV